MKTYNWWLGKKRRVRKKYTLFLSMYMSPKEVRELYKRLKVGTRASALAWLWNEHFELKEQAHDRRSKSDS